MIEQKHKGLSIPKQCELLSIPVLSAEKTDGAESGTEVAD